MIASFNVNHVSPIEWDDEPFERLVLSPARKNLLYSLIATHSEGTKLGLSEDIHPRDDFIQGRGQGLVITLFGPPGVGKTLSAEAISEHLRKPLYTTGSENLGTQAEVVNKRLEDACNMASRWNAVLLIDEVRCGTLRTREHLI